MAPIRIRHKEFEGLTFGPGDDVEYGTIQFGVKGGFPPGEAIVDEDHPLWDDLWRREGANLEVVSDGPAKVYVSPIDPSLEFPSRPALLNSIRIAAQTGDPVAVAWLRRNADADDEPEELPSRPSFSAPQDDVEAAPTANKPLRATTAPAKRRATRRGKGRSATRQSRVVSQPAPLPPAAPAPSDGV